MKKYIFAASFLLSISAHADLAYELADLVGWQISYSGTITGFVDRDGAKKDSFEGCDFDRKLILDDRFTVTCRTYRYSYRYRPKAVLLKNGSMMKMIIGDDIYDVGR